MIKNQPLTSHISDDIQFLVNCCKINPTEEDISSIHSHLNTLSLSTITSIASQHGILPVVYKTLKESSQTNSSTQHQLPITHSPSDNALGIDEILSTLKQEYLSIAQRNMLMSAELIRIMKLLEKNNIEALAFKGPTLSQIAYGDITLRQYLDLDILVDENYIFETGELISSHGYTPDSDINFLKNDKLLELSSDLGFRNVHNNVYMELHWKLFRKKLSITLDGLNIRSNPTLIKIQDKEIKTLQSDFLLVYLCAHGSKHMWERIEWITDIDRVIRNIESINWINVWKYAQKMRSTNTLLLGLSLSHELFETNLPDFIKKKIVSHDNIQLLKIYTLELLNLNTSVQSSETIVMFKKFDYHAKLQDSFWDKIKFYLTTLFEMTPNDVLSINLSKPFYFLYYIIRPFRLLWKYVRK